MTLRGVRGGRGRGEVGGGEGTFLLKQKNEKHVVMPMEPQCWCSRPETSAGRC